MSLAIDNTAESPRTLAARLRPRGDGAWVAHTATGPYSQAPAGPLATLKKFMTETIAGDQAHQWRQEDGDWILELPQHPPSAGKPPTTATHQNTPQTKPQRGKP